MGDQIAILIPARIRKWIYGVLGTLITTEIVLDGYGYGLVPEKPQQAAIAVLSALGFGLAFSQVHDRGTGS